MTNAFYLSAAVLLSLLVMGCRQKYQEGRRLKPIHVALLKLKDAAASESDLALRMMRDLVSEHGNQPADSLLLRQAQGLHQQAQDVWSLPGHLPLDTIRQRLQRLDRQALLLGKVTPYTRAGHIHQYLALLEETQQDTGTAAALRTGLQVQIARHTNLLLTTLTRQVENRPACRLRLIPVVRQLTDSVDEGELFQVEVFPLEIFALPSDLRPAITVNGKIMRVEEGVGKVRFTVAGPPGKKTWEGKLTLRLPNGRDTSFYEQVDYFVLP